MVHFPFPPGSHPRGLLFAAVLLAASPGWAQQGGKITATVDRSEITMEDQLRLTVTIEGSRRATPELPPIRGFDVHQGGGTTTQFQMGGGGYRSTITQTFILVPKGPGTFVIPAIKTTINGSIYRSTPFQVQVFPVSQAPNRPRELFIQTTISSKTAYLKQQLLYTWRFFRKSNVPINSRSPRAEFPNFEGFVSVQFDGQREYPVTVRGQSYSVTEIKFALVPLEEGELTIGPSALHVDVVQPGQRRSNGLLNGIFQSQSTVPKKLTSAAFTVTITPLPPAPANFSGLVGEFTLQGNLSSRSIAVGESTTLALRLKGIGSLKGFTEPTLSLPDFKVYQDKTTSTEEVTSAGISSLREFRTALVPLKAGRFTLPPVKITYFNPKLQRYDTVASRGYTLAVHPGAKKEELNLTGAGPSHPLKAQVQMLGDDILPLHKRLNDLQSPFASGRTLPVRAGLLAFPPLLFAMFFGIYRRSNRERHDRSLKRRRLAMPQAVKRLKSAGASADQQVAVGSIVLREYIGDKLNLEGKALTAGETAGALQDAAVTKALIDEVRAFLNQTEASQYAAPGDPAHQRPSIIAAVQQLLTRLDKELPS